MLSAEVFMVNKGDAVAKTFGREYWEERYQDRGEGGPSLDRWASPQLAAEAADLEPGTALDAGCGRGGDAVWLASRGWRVHAVDVSATALDQGRERARGLGDGVADRIEWERADLTVWSAPEGQYDLVSTQYVHTTGPRRELFGRLASAVAPGGTLVIVGHHPGDGHSTHAHGSDPEVHFTAEEVAGDLAPERWEVLVAEDRSRAVHRHGGGELTIVDAVVRARRRA